MGGGEHPSRQSSRSQDWTSYILPLLFFKRICDCWHEEHEAMLAEYGEDFADEHRFQIPEGCQWSNIRAVTRNVGTALANAMRAIEAANQKHLYGVFGDAQWTNKDRLPDELLKDLIEHFSALSLANARVTSDVMGDAYEYLIKQFADATNKKAGEFYTPRSVVRLMVDILGPKEGETIYDPACGTGGMLLAAVAHVRERGGDPRTFARRRAYPRGVDRCTLSAERAVGASWTSNSRCSGAGRGSTASASDRFRVGRASQRRSSSISPPARPALIQGLGAVK